MTTIASLRVALEADTSKFAKGLKRASDSAKKIGTAVAAVGSGFAALLQGSLNSADALQKMSLRTGVSVEALSALEHQAKLSGTSIDQMERGIVNLQKNIGKAAIGSKEQADAIHTLGLNLVRLQQLRPEEQFGEVADALNRVENESQRAQIGNALLGRGYRELSPLIKGGSAGMREAAIEAGRLGAILSSDTAEAAAKANDAMQRIRTTFQGVFRTLHVSLSPEIEELANMLAENLPAAIAATKAAFAGVGEGIGGSASAFENIGKAATATTRGFGRAAGKLAEGDVSGAFTEVGKGFSEMSARFGDAFDTFAELPGRIGDAVDRSIDDSLRKNTGGESLSFSGEDVAKETAEGNRILGSIDRKLGDALAPRAQ